MRKVAGAILGGSAGALSPAPPSAARTAASSKSPVTAIQRFLGAARSLQRWTSRSGSVRRPSEASSPREGFPCGLFPKSHARA